MRGGVIGIRFVFGFRCGVSEGCEREVAGGEREEREMGERGGGVKGREKGEDEKEG